jgi:hypothetical protein
VPIGWAAAASPNRRSASALAVIRGIAAGCQWAHYRTPLSRSASVSSSSRRSRPAFQ